MHITNTASIVQLHLLEGISIIRVSEFAQEFNGYSELREHFLAYEGVKETDNRDVLSINDCYSDLPGTELPSWEVVLL